MDNTQTRSHVRRNDSIPDTRRWVNADLMGTRLRAFLQAIDNQGRGLWVQFDADAPFRLVPQVFDDTGAVINDL